jgi:hypothetical protein
MKKHKIKYVVLAKSIPEYSKRDEICYTCSLGYSPEMGLIRVYPLPVVSMNKWDIYEIIVEKNKYDTRNESWKLSSYARKESWMGLSKDVVYLGKANPEKMISIIANYKTSSLKELNANKKSIGLIDIKEYRLYWEKNKRHIDSRQYGLFEDVEIADFTKYTKESKDKEARIYFRDTKGEHDLQYNEWQVYEFQRRFKATDEAFRFMKNKNLLFVGNMHNYRTAWIALGMFEYNCCSILF